uniref:ENPP1-3/EXOG-like endonuclease/phosphodiesterase domain-containing protein n=1 Tax=Oryzias latipes TaxID=8090 RepID=A0A3P9J7W3_ORYLA
MEKASCEKAVFVSNYLPHTSDFEVIQGPAARIRPKFSSRLGCKSFYLQNQFKKQKHLARQQILMILCLFFLFCFQGIFYWLRAWISTKHNCAPFENIEVYNLMCDLLNIRPAPNNGTHGSLNHLLKNPVHHPVHPAQLSHETPCEAAEPAPHTAFKNRVHHPYGTPGVVQSGANFCLLYTQTTSMATVKTLMPLWVSYSIQLWSEGDVCVRADVRVPLASSQQCLQYKDGRSLTYGLLHPHCGYHSSRPCFPADKYSKVLIANYLLPKLSFYIFPEVWSYIHQSLLPKYSKQLNGINILSGPIFDTDYDGNVDPVKEVSGNEASIPTHFFLILNSCQNLTLLPTNCVGPLKVQSFILPHRPDYSEVCKSDLEFVESWMSFHTARVRDIELLTGLSFYHSMISVEETLQLKTFLDTQRAIENS